MPRKVALPGAAELFRATASVVDAPGGEATPAESSAAQHRRRSTGRVRHDEKITVYVSKEELGTLEQARLQLRTDYGLAVDRGRIVREAIALSLEGLACEGEGSDLVQRLRES